MRQDIPVAPKDINIPLRIKESLAIMNRTNPAKSKPSEGNQGLPSLSWLHAARARADTHSTVAIGLYTRLPIQLFS
jgi:hypothetical protein